MNKLPSYTKIIEDDVRDSLVDAQFGPDGADHLFLFSKTELKGIMPAENQIICGGYTGGTILINRYTLPLLRIFSPGILYSFMNILSKIPILNSKTFNGIYLVIRKSTI